AVYAASPAVYQEWQVAADAQRKDSLRLVACEEAGGPMIGYGCLWPVHQPPVRGHVAVHPRWHRRGIRGLPWEALRGAIVSYQGATAEGRVWEARVEAARFLRRRGFVPAQYLPGLRLVLADADLSALERRRDRAAAQGFRFTTLRQEQARAPDWSAKLQDLLNEVWPDMPQMTPGPYDPAATRAAPLARSFGTVEALACLTSWPEAFFLAAGGGRYVGWG